MSKMNTRLSVVRPALLALALLLSGIATIPPAFAACLSGATRTIIVNSNCCALSPPKVTKQNQKCVSGVWVNTSGTFCGAVPVCAI